MDFEAFSESQYNLLNVDFAVEVEAVDHLGVFPRLADAVVGRPVKDGGDGEVDG